jgi:hypothetical protein
MEIITSQGTYRDEKSAREGLSAQGYTDKQIDKIINPTASVPLDDFLASL